MQGWIHFLDIFQRTAWLKDSCKLGQCALVGCSYEVQLPAADTPPPRPPKISCNDLK